MSKEIVVVKAIPLDQPDEGCYITEVTYSDGSIAYVASQTSGAYVGAKVTVTLGE